MLAHLVVPFAVLLALPGRALAHDWQVCAPPALPFSSNASARAMVTTTALNFVTVSVCAAPNATNTTCARGAPLVYPCPGLVFPGNGTFYVNISVAGATGLLFEYHTQEPFSWHTVQSSPAQTRMPWPPKGGIDILNLPLPVVPDLLLCDGDDDCPAGPCLTSAAPPHCKTAVAPVPPPLPSSPPLPPPPPGPAAAACNISGQWKQSSIASLGGAAGDDADAYISITVGPAPGDFSFVCIASHKPCPGGLPALNGTGTLSAKDASFVLRPQWNGTATLAGAFNSTYDCSVMSLTGLPPAQRVQWVSANPPPQSPFDLHVTTATFLGTGSGPRQLVATAVAILAAPEGGPTIVAVAGNGGPVYPGVTTQLLLNASAATDNGTVVVLSVPAAGEAPPTVLRVLKLGGRVDHARANAVGALAVAGSFGIAVLAGVDDVAAGVGATVAWHDDLAGIKAGTCGVCCADDGSRCRLDIGDDGVVAATLAASAGNSVDDGGALLWAAFSAAGARIMHGAVAGAQALTAVYVDAPRHRFGVAYFYNSYTGREPMVMPRLEVYSYAALPPAVVLTALPWDAAVYRQPGPCDGNVADARIQDLRLGRDGTLVVAGRSDGGDTPFACGLRDVQRAVPFVAYDAYTQSYNMQSQAITNLLRVDAASGEATVGQIQLTRLDRSGGNSLFTRAVHADAAGAVYELQNAGYALPDMANLTINGQPLAAACDATALLVSNAGLNVRRHWTHFVKRGASPSDAGSAVELDVRGGAVAAVLTTSADTVTVQPLPGTAANVGGAPVAYLVVLPTVA